VIYSYDHDFISGLNVKIRLSCTIEFFLLDGNDAMAFSSLGGAGIIFADSERATLTLYSRFIDILCLSCTIQKLYNFVLLAVISASEAFLG